MRKKGFSAHAWLAAGLGIALGAASAAWADHDRYEPRDDRPERYQRYAPRDVLPGDFYRVDKRDRGSRSPRDEAAERARRETGGRVLSIEERSRRDDREGYRVRILTPEGEVRYYDVGPGNGRGRR